MTKIAAGLVSVFIFMALHVMSALAAEPPTVTLTEPVMTTSTTAELTGTVDIHGGEGVELYAEYATSEGEEFHFQFLPTQTIPTGTEGSTQISGVVHGLQPNTRYFFRFVTENSEWGEVPSQGPPYPNAVTQPEPARPPQIGELRPSEVSQTAVTLEATINPEGGDTAYYFEWGTSASYGTQERHETVPAGGEQSVSAVVSGLEPHTTYHWRVVATNAGGSEVTSADQQVETLDSCGLPALRCLELVSPREMGPIATPGIYASNRQLRYQAASNGSSLAYMLEYGLPEATRGAEVLYLADRGPSGWGSTQLSPGIAQQNVREGGSGSDTTWVMSNNLSCSILTSSQLLTNDPGPRQMYEAGQESLYRRNPNGTYTAISNLAATNITRTASVPYFVRGISEDCDTVLFESYFEYPGLPVLPRGLAEDEQRFLYEWHDGTLSAVAKVPGSGGENVLIPTPLAGSDGNSTNIVSRDGSKVFFAAERKVAPNPGDPAEIGTTGIFVRHLVNGAPIVEDISGSDTATPDLGATYQYATPDGSRVFFTANAGLAAPSNTEGEDLYEYDFATGKLTDRSVSQAEVAADVAGVLGVAPDGSHVYFASPLQLVTGRGSTTAENAANQTYSIYDESKGAVQYVGRLRQAQAHESARRIFLSSTGDWSSRVSEDGQYLLFESSANVTGYDSGGANANEAYLFNAQDGDTVCLSCRPDGQPSVAAAQSEAAPLFVLPSAGAANLLYANRSLVMVNGQPRVFFTSRDQLAPGAAEGLANVYEWAHGQVATISAEPSGYLPPSAAGMTNKLTNNSPMFWDASVDGADLYFATPKTLTWEDSDGRMSIYDARSDGGFSRPQDAGSCEALVEGSCQAPETFAVPTGIAGTTGINGAGNVTKKKQHKKHRHKKHRHKKHRHMRRHGNGNRGADK
ncbi:MAG TPA: hypothetical protein VGC32_05930 [Solirubrobacterales bacterium]